MGIIMPETCWVNENKHLYLWHLVGSFLSYINDARSHELKIQFCKINRSVFFSFGMVTQALKGWGRGGVSFACKRPEFKALPGYGKRAPQRRNARLDALWRQMSETDAVVVAARFHADSSSKFGIKLGQRARVWHCVYAVVGWFVSKFTC